MSLFEIDIKKSLMYMKKPEEEIKNMEQLVLTALDDLGPLHVMEITEQVDEHPLSVDRTCGRLHDYGHIAPVGVGRYQLTNNGRQRLSDNCTRDP